MATGKSLELRKIQPKDRPAGLPQPNDYRRMCREIARELKTTETRVKKAMKRDKYPGDLYGKG